MALPKTGGVLFGRRLVNHSLKDIVANPVLATVLDDRVTYKIFDTSRERILQLMGHKIAMKAPKAAPIVFQP